jgi:hypothetical protein
MYVSRKVDTKQSEASRPIDTNERVLQKHMLLAFLNTMERESIDYVILSGYRNYPENITSDVDFMVSEQNFARLLALFSQENSMPGCLLVQAHRHETSACCYVFAQQTGTRIAYLHSDMSANYRRNTRLWLPCQQVLETRRKSRKGFWIPAASVEFEYYLIKRIGKVLIGKMQLQALSGLLQEDPAGCREVLIRYFDRPLANDFESALLDNALDWFDSNIKKLSYALSQSTWQETFNGRVGNRLKDLFRIVRRVISPAGLVIAVLGPDGSRKSIVIDHLNSELGPAFRQAKEFHVSFNFDRTSGSNTPCTQALEKVARGTKVSIPKTIKFVVGCWFEWLRTVYPAKIRSTLVIFDCSFRRMEDDSRLCPLRTHFVLPRVLSYALPKPDLYFILDAPPTTLRESKAETSMKTAREFRISAEELTRRLTNSVFIDGESDLDETLVKIVADVTRHLSKRVKVL